MKEFLLCFLCLAAAGCGLDQSTSRSDKPVSRDAALKEIDIPFPLSATNIYYIFHAGGLQELQMFVRFTVDPGAESNAVEEIFADHNKRTREFDSYPAVSLENKMSSADQSFSPMPWWNPGAISNGYCRGSINGQPFYIWADLSQHTIYVHASD